MEQVYETLPDAVKVAFGEAFTASTEFRSAVARRDGEAASRWARRAYGAVSGSLRWCETADQRSLVTGWLDRFADHFTVKAAV